MCAGLAGGAVLLGGGLIWLVENAMSLAYAIEPERIRSAKISLIAPAGLMLVLIVGIGLLAARLNGLVWKVVGFMVPVVVGILGAFPVLVLLSQFWRWLSGE